MAEKRIHNPDKSSSANVSRVSRSHDQDGHHTHIWYKPQLLCLVTVIVDSQVSNHWPLGYLFFCFFSVTEYLRATHLFSLPFDTQRGEDLLDTLF